MFCPWPPATGWYRTMWLQSNFIARLLIRQLTDETASHVDLFYKQMFCQKHKRMVNDSLGINLLFYLMAWICQSDRRTLIGTAHRFAISFMNSISQWNDIITYASEKVDSIFQNHRDKTKNMRERRQQQQQQKTDNGNLWKKLDWPRGFARSNFRLALVTSPFRVSSMIHSYYFFLS